MDKQKTYHSSYWPKDGSTPILIRNATQQRIMMFINNIDKDGFLFINSQIFQCTDNKIDGEVVNKIEVLNNMIEFYK